MSETADKSVRQKRCFPRCYLTCEAAAYAIKGEGLDGTDRHLRKAMAYKLVQIMQRWKLEKKVARNGRDGGAVVWRKSG